MPSARKAPATSGSDLPRIADDIGFLLSRASGRAVHATNAQLSGYGLRVRPYSVLLAVSEGGGRTQREVADLLGLDPSQIVALVDELQDKGLVERRTDGNDRRRRLVVPTDEGRRLGREAERAARRADDLYLGDLDAAERASLVGLLRRMTRLP